MSVQVAVAGEVRRLPIARGRLGRIVRMVLRTEGARDARISIAFVSPATIARLNHRHFGKRRPTDVIAFSFAPVTRHSPLVGDIYIAPAIARANARDFGVGVREQLARLVVHGTLHVLGYDHPADGGRDRSAMWRRQERLLSRALRSR